MGPFAARQRGGAFRSSLPLANSHGDDRGPGLVAGGKGYDPVERHRPLVIARLARLVRLRLALSGPPPIAHTAKGSASQIRIAVESKRP